MGFNDFYSPDIEKDIKNKNKLLEDSYKIISNQKPNMETQNKNLSALYKRLGYSAEETPQFNQTQSKFSIQDNPTWESQRQKSLMAENEMNRPKPTNNIFKKDINIPSLPKIGATENVAPTQKKSLGDNLYDFFIGGRDSNTTIGKLNKREEEKKAKVSDYVSKYGYLPKNATKEEEEAYYNRFSQEYGIREKNSLDWRDSNRIISSIADAIAPGQADEMDILIRQNSQNKGSGIGNTVTNMAGNMIGMAMNPGSVVGGGKNLLNVTDDLAEGVARKVTPKIGQIGQQAVRGIVDGSVGGALDTVRGNDFDNLGSNVVGGAIGGGVLSAGGSAIGKGINKLANINNPELTVNQELLDQFSRRSMNDNNISMDINSNLPDLPNTPRRIKQSEAKDILPTIYNRIGEVENKRNNVDLEPSKVEVINNTTNDIKPTVEPNNVNKIDFNEDSNLNDYKFNDRTFDDIGKLSYAKGSLSENRELAYHIQQYAQMLDNDIRFGTKGGELTIDKETGKRMATSRVMAEHVEIIKAHTGASYKNIQDSLKRIANGEVTNALDRKIEVIIDDALTNGTRTALGDVIPPNESYIENKKLLQMISDNEYDKSYPQIESPTVEPMKSSNSEIASTVKPNDVALDLDGGNIKESRHASVTMPNSENITDELKNELKNYGFEYEVSNNQIAYDKAIEFTNKADSYGTYMRSVSKNDQDTVNGIALIQKMQKELSSTTDKEIKKAILEKIVDVTAKLSDDLTNAGKTIQAASIVNRLSPEGKLISIQREFKKVADEITKKNNIDIKKEIADVKNSLDKATLEKDAADTLVKELNDIATKELNVVNSNGGSVDAKLEADIDTKIKDGQKELTPAQKLEEKKKKEKEKPTPAQLLANRVDKTIKTQETKDRDLEKELVSTLFNISKKTLPKSEVEKVDPYSLVVNALKNKNKYQNVFAEAKRILIKKYGEGSKEYNLLSDWIDQKARPVFFEKDMDKAISTIMKEKGIKVSEIIKDYYTNTKTRVDLVQELVSKGKLNEKDANTVFNYVNRKMKDLTKKAKEDKLKQIFTPKQAAKIISDYEKKQNSFNSIKQLKYLGAFENKNYKDLLPEKLNLQIDKIIKSDLDIGKFVREVTEQKQDVSADFMAHYIHKNTNLPQKDSDMLAQLVVERFNKIVGDKKKSILDTKFKERPKYDKNSVYERLVELDNLGVFHSEYKDLVYTKLGLPVLSPGESQIILDKMRKYNSMKDGYEKDSVLAEVNKLVQSKLPKNLGDKVSSFRYINMLLNPKTLLKNYGGNLINSTVRKGRDYLGNAIDNQIKKKTGNKTVFNPNAKAYKEGKKYGSWAAKEDYKRGIDTTDVHRENVKGDAFSEDSFLGKTERLLHNLLQRGDRPFYEAAKKEYLTNVMNHLGIEDINKVPKEYQELAHKVALEETFQNKTSIGDVAGRLTNTGNKYWDTVAKTQLPFVQTPSAVLDSSINYTPAGILRGIGNYKKAINSKDVLESMNHQRLASNQLASGTIGTGLMAAGGIGAANGLITGSFDENKDVRQLQQDMGMQEYALNVGDKMHSMEFAQPSAMPVMLGADLYKNKGKNILNAAANSIIGNSYLSGVQNLMQGYTYNGLQGALESMVGNAVGQMTPFGSLVNQVNKTVDSTKRNTKGDNFVSDTANKFINKLPLLPQVLPEKKGLYGDTQKFNEGLSLPTQIFNNFINPSNMSEYNPTVAEKTGLDNYLEANDRSAIPTGDVKFTFKGETYRPTVEEMQIYYDKLNKATNNISNAEQLAERISTTKEEFRKYIQSKHNFK